MKRLLMMVVCVMVLGAGSGCSLTYSRKMGKKDDPYYHEIGLFGYPKFVISEMEMDTGGLIPLYRHTE
jgi:hypothetical protein